MGDEKRQASWKPRSFSSSAHIYYGEFGTWIYPNSEIKRSNKLRTFVKCLAESNKKMREMGGQESFRRDSKCKCVLLKEIFKPKNY